MEIAVLGAGHGGTAMAGDLSLAGHAVRLAALADHPGVLHLLAAQGGVLLEGSTSSGRPAGFAPLSAITTSIAAAVAGASVVMVVVPAFAQAAYIDALLPCLVPGQFVVFHPGKFGALALRRRLRDAGKADGIGVGEADTLLYAARLLGGGRTWIMGVKHEIFYAALPAVDTAAHLERLRPLLPQLTPAANVLQTSVDDLAMSLHAVTTLMNASRIEQMGPYPTGHYDITPAQGRVIQAVDDERVAVARHLGYDPIDFRTCFVKNYGVTGQTVDEIIRGVSAYQRMASPDGMRHRYLTEEVPYGLVPVSDLGRLVAVPTPNTDALIQLASVACAIDFRAKGRDLADMGLAGLNLPALLAAVTTGDRSA